MTMLKVGIADVNEMRERPLRMMRKRERRDPGEPKVWAPSIKSFVKTLSEGHSDFLRAAAQNVPVPLDDLARMTGRDVSDYSGMLNKLSEMGLMETHLRDGSRLRSKVVDGHVAFVAVSNEQASIANPVGGRAKPRSGESFGRERRVAVR